MSHKTAHQALHRCLDISSQRTCSKEKSSGKLPDCLKTNSIPPNMPKTAAIPQNQPKLPATQRLPTQQNNNNQ